MKDQNLVVNTAAVFHVQGTKLSGACLLKPPVFFSLGKKKSDFIMKLQDHILCQIK